MCVGILLHCLLWSIRITSVNGILMNFDDGSSYVIVCDVVDGESKSVFDVSARNPDLFIEDVQYAHLNVSHHVGSYDTGSYVKAVRLTSQWLVWIRALYYSLYQSYDYNYRVPPYFGPCVLLHYGTVGANNMSVLHNCVWQLDYHDADELLLPDLG